MNKFKYIYKNYKALILVSLALVLSVGIGGYAIFSKMALEKQFQQQTIEVKGTKGKLLVLSETIGELQTEKEKTEKDMSRIQSENDAYQSEIAAFAKQAAACDTIKKQLHIKE